MRFPSMRLLPRIGTRYKVELFDRHSEHVGRDIELCEHGNLYIYSATEDIKPDVFIANIHIGGEVIAEVELLFVEEKTLRVVINHVDYVIARAKAGINPPKVDVTIE